MDRLSADDRLILWPDEGWPQDIGAVAVVDGGGLLDADGHVRIDVARDAVDRRIHLVPRFRQVLLVPRRGLGGPMWVDAPAFDLREHVQVAAVPRPGGDAQLLDTVEQIRRRRLDRSRPLWEMWFLPGLSDGRVALFIRLHHVVADGIAGIANLAALLGTSAETAAPPGPWDPAPWPSSRALLSDNVRRRAAATRRAFSTLGHPDEVLQGARAAWPAVQELLAAEPGPETSLGRLIGPDRNLALVRSRLDVVQGVAHAHGVTVNDVLLAAITAGLRRLLHSRNEQVEDVVLPVYVPVSLRRDRSGREGQQGGNLITQMVVPLPLGLADPGQRLRRVAAETVRRKATARPPPRGAVSQHAPRRRHAQARRTPAGERRHADLAGPREPLDFAGAQLLEAFPLVNLIGTVSLGVGALSYAGRFSIMVVADADAYPDLEVFTDGLDDELRTVAAVTPSTAPGLHTTSSSDG